jgi:hypothetical protein
LAFAEDEAAASRTLHIQTRRPRLFLENVPPTVGRRSR